MLTPIPEPYDITEIPYIAWIPGIAAWSAIFVALACIAAFMWARNNPRRARGDLKIIDKLIAELKVAVNTAAGLNIERTSRIARRIVSYISGRNVSELTADELRSSIDEKTSPRLAEIMRAVASFEEVGYAPPSPQRASSARDLAAQLAALIEKYRNELRVR